MAKYRVTLIPGAGIGPEVTGTAVRVIEAAGVDIELQRHRPVPTRQESGQPGLLWAAFNEHSVHWI